MFSLGKDPVQPQSTAPVATRPHLFTYVEWAAFGILLIALLALWFYVQTRTKISEAPSQTSIISQEMLEQASAHSTSSVVTAEELKRVDAHSTTSVITPEMLQNASAH